MKGTVSTDIINIPTNQSEHERYRQYRHHNTGDSILYVCTFCDRIKLVLSDRKGVGRRGEMCDGQKVCLCGTAEQILVTAVCVCVCVCVRACSLA